MCVGGVSSGPKAVSQALVAPASGAGEQTKVAGVTGGGHAPTAASGSSTDVLRRIGELMDALAGVKALLAGASRTGMAAAISGGGPGQVPTQSPTQAPIPAGGAASHRPITPAARFDVMAGELRRLDASRVDIDAGARGLATSPFSGNPAHLRYMASELGRIDQSGIDIDASARWVQSEVLAS